MPTLYHYCSAATFHSIVSHRSIWLSSLSQSNDSLEGRLISASVARHAELDKLDRRSAMHIEHSIVQVEENTDALGFCLSEEGDLLSQWRGYASDGIGFAIGFDDTYLQTLCDAGHPSSTTHITLGKVRYSTAEHDMLINPIYERFRKLAAESMLRKGSWPATIEGKSLAQIRSEVDPFTRLSDAILAAQISVVPTLYLLKSAAFSEEKEWRILAPYLTWLPEMLQYRHANGQIAPYREYGLTVPTEGGLSRVVLGPRNRTPINVVRDFLHSCGFKQASVEKSSATYR
jgi:Protein of unknown function (DUF2971)